MHLKEKTLGLIKKLNLDKNLDQHFLIDSGILDKMVGALEIENEDVILEIGPGTGNITEIAAQKAKKVIGFERDERFRQILSKMPDNVEIWYDDALKLLKEIGGFTKIISNLPYQISEPFLQYLCTARNIKLVVLIVPKSVYLILQKHPIFSAFLKASLIAQVAKEAFLPAPDTDSVLISIAYKKDDREDEDAFLRRKLFLQKDKKLKNALRETLIDLRSLNGQKLTKNQARGLLERLKIPLDDLEKEIDKFPQSIFEEMAKKIKESI
jgi:16S rRNA (adenine1518-N6/adenine1519-N6)-dimethyltransferase